MRLGPHTPEEEIHVFCPSVPVEMMREIERVTRETEKLKLTKTGAKVDKSDS